VEFTVQVQDVDGATVVSAAGELDIHTAPELQDALDAPTRTAGRRVIVDLAEVPFVDSTGISVLVVALKHVREAEGSLDVVVTSPRVLKVLALTGLDVVIPVHATREEALAAS
jgi:anti-sigma B factor antagonist